MQHSRIVHVHRTGFVTPPDPFLVEGALMRTARLMDKPRNFLVPQAFNTGLRMAGAAEQQVGSHLLRGRRCEAALSVVKPV